MSFPIRRSIYIAFVSIGIATVLCITNSAAQEQSDAFQQDANSNEIEVRKLYVPEEAAAIVLGELKNAGQQYLPIDVKSIESLLASGKSESPTVFEQAEFDLKLSGKNLLVGTGSFLVQDAGEPISIEFRSDVWIDEPVSASDLVLPPQVGRRNDGVQVFQTMTGGRFTSNVKALLGPSTGFSTIQFPTSRRGVIVRISVPESLSVISRQSIGELHLCLIPSEDDGNRHFLIDSPDGRVDLRLLESTNRKRIVSVDADLQFDSSSAMINFQTKLKLTTAQQDGLRVNLPTGFICSRVFISGNNVSFQPLESVKSLAGSNQIFDRNSWID